MSTIAAIARGEAVRLVRHPVFLAGVAITAVIHVLVPFERADMERYGALSGQAMHILGGAAMVSAFFAGIRTRRGRTAELEITLPVTPMRRTIGQIAGFLAAPAVGLVALVPLWLAYLGPDLRLAVGPEVWTPDVADLAQGPTAVLTLTLIGFAVGTVAPAVVVGPIGAAALVWSPLVWFSPWVIFDPGVAHPSGDAVGSATWHLAFLIGLAAIGAGVALSRVAPRPKRFALVLVPAAILAATGGILRFA